MIGDGGNLRHPIFIEDMLKAFELMIQWEDLVGTETFLVGGPAAITTQELVDTFVAEFEFPKPKIRLPKTIGKGLAEFSETVFRLVGKEPPFSTRSLEFFETNNAFNIRKAADQLNFSPQFSFAEGLRRSRQWLEANC
jgi:nucleoside-diphosphate-sugar epimerase